MGPNRLLDGVIVSARLKFTRIKKQVARDTARLVRAGVPKLSALMNRAVEMGIALSRWVRTVVIGALWICFEAYTRAWEFLEPIIQDVAGRPMKNGHRAVFCVAVSMILGHTLMLRFTPFGLDLWSMVFWLAHGLAIHAYWDQGTRWCRRQLGIRPTRFNPAKPYDNLDLGN